MNKKNILLVSIVMIIFIAIISIATYAYFATGILNISNVANLNVVTERNNMIFDTLGGEMTLNVTAANMSESLSGNVAAENNTTLTVNFMANTDYSMVCTYDIVYEWTSSDKYMAHTTGVSSNEFTIQGTLASNAHVNEGTNNIKSETDLSTLTYTNYAATVVSGAQIDGIGSTISTAVWTLTSKFYNVAADQSDLSDKTYAGKFRVANVSCVAGNVILPGPTSYWFDNDYSSYVYPDHSTLQANGADIGRVVYVGQDDSKYYTCANDRSGHEVCLSQPYTQYGLEGHVVDTRFTEEQQASAKQAIYQAFIDAGITVDIDTDCSANSADAYCYGDVYQCGVTDNGHVDCRNNLDQYNIYVYEWGNVYIRFWGD